MQAAKSSPRESAVMMVSRRMALAVLFIASGMPVMAASSEEPAITASNAVVTLDLYSGRPNPAWPLSAVATHELLHRLQALDVMKVDTPEFDGLGYRAVRAELHEQAKRAAVVTAARGVVTVEQAGRLFRYADADRQFELWLVNTGTGHIAPDVLQYVAAEIAK
jgi:hypothetical protein